MSPSFTLNLHSECSHKYTYPVPYVPKVPRLDTPYPPVYMRPLAHFTLYTQSAHTDIHTPLPELPEIKDALPARLYTAFQWQV